MSFDIILSEIAGTCSPYQILVCIFMGILGKFYVAMLIFLNVFTAYEMDYKCKVDNRSAVAVDKCHQRSIDSNVTMSCTEWIFDRSIFESTIRSQYSLVCEKEWLVPLSSMMHMVGMFISGPVWGVLSDMYGRMLVIELSAVVGGLSVILLSYAPYFWIYLILRVLTGFASVGGALGINTYHVEIAPAHRRLEYITITMTGFNFGSLIMVLIAYLERDHKNIQMFLSPFAFVNLLLPLFLCESPRWLLVEKGREAAYSACKWIAKMNRKTLSEERFHELCNIVEEQEIPENRPIWDIMVLPNLRRVSFALWVCFACSGFIYYVLNFGSGVIDGSIFFNFSMMIGIEFPARLITYAGTKYQGRLPMLTASYFTIGVCILSCAPLILYSKAASYFVFLYFAASFFTSIAFEVLWLYSHDIYPTAVRTSGVSVSQTFSRVGAILAPLTENLIKLWRPASFVVSGSAACVAAVTVWCTLPETGKMETKDYIHEAEEFIEKNKKTLCSRDCLCCRNPGPDEIEISKEEEVPFAQQ